MFLLYRRSRDGSVNFLGMGPLELLLIIIIAFVVLGPTRLMGMARSIGKVVGELRDTVGEATRAMEEEEQHSSTSKSKSPEDTGGLAGIARTIGRGVAELRDTFGETTRAIEEEEKRAPPPTSEETKSTEEKR